ncbi:MAG TPA: c-type cytochrome [Rhizomicrobium sp.]|jgi:cytochrome c
MRVAVVALCTMVAALPLAARAAGDAAKGQTAFGQCAGCHGAAKDAAPSMGPNLWRIFGRQVGSEPDYAYSESMKNAGFTWKAEKLKAFLENPGKVVPDSNMYYMGTTPAEADDIVAYLATLQ